MQLPLGTAQISRNNRYTPTQVGTRWGFSNRLTFGAQNSRLAGAGVIRYLANDESGKEVIGLCAYTQADGNIYGATPFLQSSVTQLTTDAFISMANLPRIPGINPVVTQSFNKGMIAMGDLTSGVAPNMIYDPNAGTIDQVSDIPFGAPWNPGKRYRVGHMISPSTFETYGLPVEQGVWVAAATGHLYRCITAGTSGAAPPTWPTAQNSSVADNTVEWQETTPECLAGLPDPPAAIVSSSAPDGYSPITSGATIFIALTYNNTSGEGINELVDAAGILDPNRVLEWVNTSGGARDLTVTLPAIPPDIGTSGPLGAKGATSYNVYAYIVQGTPDVTNYTDPTFYARAATGLAPGASLTISAFPTGQALPLINTATVADAGNVDTGIRWMVVMFEMRSTYITGFGATSPIRVNVSQANLVVRVNIPTGPYNTKRRICAFTVAGASSAGPYTYVDQDDVESPGFNQADVPITSTCINDNTTKTAQFNFTDTYLPGASNVTNYFNRIEVPPASAIKQSQTLSMNVYTGCTGFPSGYLISDLLDGEAVRNPGSNLPVAQSDGDRTVGWCEIRENQIALKENSGHAVIPNDGDPNTWAVHRLWGDSGPAGAKAWDVATEDAADFLIYAHQTGPYRCVSNTPQLIGKEVGALVNTSIQGLWKRINWEYGYKIVTKIDVSRREVRFAVPLDGATENNKVLTLSYALGWDDPIIFIVRTGREVPNISGRRWSVDDLVAMDFAYVPRRYQVETSQAGVDLSDNLLLCAADGALYTLTEGQLYDENWSSGQIGYLSQWLGVPGPNPTLQIMSLQGATVAGSGNGQLNVYAEDEKGRRVALSTDARTMILTNTDQQRDFGLRGVQGVKWGIGFDNGGKAGAGYLLNTAILWLRKFYASRLG
ncbi:MAG TPA: hypothetical protein VGU67_02920 [Edaphobacter sp.]|nr:hypothetical protein [Edaphobacter sp.]